jgi:single-stranded DNA-binding protein
MMVGAFRGRLGCAAKKGRKSQDGEGSAWALVLINLTKPNSGSNFSTGTAPVALSVTAYGRQAEELLSVKKGESVTVTGRITRKASGQDLEQLAIIADVVIGPKTDLVSEPKNYFIPGGYEMIIRSRRTEISEDAA